MPILRDAQLLPVLLLLLLLALGATSARADKDSDGTKRTFAPAPPSGFLQDYGRLETHPRDELTRLWQSREALLADYDQFIIDDVAVLLGEGTVLNEARHAELPGLAKQLQEAFTKQLRQAKRYDVVKTPGPRTLRIRLALTDIEPVGKGKRVAGSATGAAVGVVLPGASLLLPRFDVGWASIEMELIDTGNGKPVSRAMSSHRGGRVGGGLFGRFKRWGDARRAFDSWAKQFRANVDAAHRAR